MCGFEDGFASSESGIGAYPTAEIIAAITSVKSKSFDLTGGDYV
jgi:hypothetical protein